MITAAPSPTQGVTQLPLASLSEASSRSLPREQNEMCARIFAAEPVTYPGLMREWAVLVIESSEAPPADWEAEPLCQQRAA